MANSDPLIKVEDVRFSYKVNEPILKGVSFSIHAGEFVAITGSSGSGKSTLFYLLGALSSKFQGRLYFKGRSYHEMNARELSIFRNREIGFVFQQFHLLPRASVLENVLMPTYFPFENSRPTESDRERAIKLLGQLGLAGLEHRKPQELSGGQQQRVAIARALIRDPDVILADEPTGNLDSKSTASVVEVFRELNQSGKTIILITHSHEIAEQCSRVLQFKDGMLESDIRNAKAVKTEVHSLEKPPPPENRKSLFRHYLRSLGPAWDNIKRTKRKAALTMLGVILGIAAVLSTMSLGSYAKEKILQSYQTLGVNTLNVSGYYNWRRSSRDFAPAVFRFFSPEKDVMPLIDVFNEIEMVSPVISDWGNTFNYGGRSFNEKTATIGVSEQYYRITNQELEAGRSLNYFDVLYSHPVCLIGAAVKTNLFMSENPVGKTVTVLDSGQGNGIPCRVVGVLAPQSSQSDSFQPDAHIFMPFTYLEKSMSNPWQREIRELRIKIKEGFEPDVIGRQIEGYFKSRYGNTGQFSANSNAKVIEQMKLFLTVFSSLLTAVALIALLVGGVGINNMMLVNLTERLKEIGLRKALGSTPSQIRALVLTESLVLCGLGGLIGLITGFISYHGLIYAATRLIPNMAYAWVIEPWAILLSLGAIAFTGILSGLTPTLKAEGLDVIEALRQE